MESRTLVTVSTGLPRWPSRAPSPACRPCRGCQFYPGERSCLGATVSPEHSDKPLPLGDRHAGQPPRQSDLGDASCPMRAAVAASRVRSGRNGRINERTGKCTAFGRMYRADRVSTSQRTITVTRVSKYLAAGSLPPFGESGRPTHPSRPVVSSKPGEAAMAGPRGPSENTLKTLRLRRNVQSQALDIQGPREAPHLRPLRRTGSITDHSTRLKVWILVSGGRCSGHNPLQARLTTRFPQQRP